MNDAYLGPGARLDDYRLERFLGDGAIGLVFMATAAGGTTVALKVLRPERAPQTVTVARFLREERLARRIESRHVAPILAVGEAAGYSYLVLPYFRGGSLAGRLRERGRLPVAETVGLAAQLGRGLDALHAHGILHRDVKPSNVLLDGEGTAALADFGLARARDSTRLTDEGQLLGTPHYLAPELIEGADATAASDVYALGCLLYECAVGEPPFVARSLTELGFAHLAEPPPDPRDRSPGVSAKLTHALLAALEKDPAARPTSGTALARMLHVGHSSSPV